jgi:hypothetical protein
MGGGEGISGSVSRTKFKKKSIVNVLARCPLSAANSACCLANLRVSKANQSDVSISIRMFIIVRESAQGYARSQTMSRICLASGARRRYAGSTDCLLARMQRILYFAWPQHLGSRPAASRCAQCMAFVFFHARHTANHSAYIPYFDS